MQALDRHVARSGCSISDSHAEYLVMARLLDLYGFVAVLLHAASLVSHSLLVGSVVYLALLVAPLVRRARGVDAALLLGSARRWVLAAAAAVLAVTLIEATLQAAVLAATLEAPLGVAFEANFAQVAAGITLTTLAVALLAAPELRPDPGGAPHSASSLCHCWPL
jgi:hypothetical protein